MARSTVKDMGLAGAGNRKIDWVARHAPVLGALRDSYLSDGSMRGLRVGMILPLEAKTAYLASVLADVGAEVAIAGTAPAYVQDDVAAGLVTRGVTVFASSADSPDESERNRLRVLEFRPDALIDDRAELVALLARHAELRTGIRGASEETTSGVTRLRAMERQGALPFPVIAANNARCKHLFDNRYGTGQAAMMAIMDITNLFMAGKDVVMVGYGWCGKGLAKRARGVAAHVTVVEIDPVKGLEAYADGFMVHSLDHAVDWGDIFVTSTGVPDAIDPRHIARMKDGAMLANAGGIDIEIDESKLRAMAVSEREARPHITEFTLCNGRHVNLLAHGMVVNLAAADGHPIEVMDLTFSVQALGLWYVVRHYHELERRVYPFPGELDHAIARLKLDSLGMEVAGLTPEQERFLESWE